MKNNKMQVVHAIYFLLIAPWVMEATDALKVFERLNPRNSLWKHLHSSNLSVLASLSIKFSRNCLPHKSHPLFTDFVHNL